MRQLWRDLAKSHRKLIDSHALDQAPLHRRIWYFHLSLPCSFLKIAGAIEVKGLGVSCRMQYCRLADRLFGGTRQEQYCQKLSRDNDRRREELKELTRQFQERKERRSQEELQYQSLTNPNFVVTNRSYRDRH